MKQTISLGGHANDGTGITLRDAFIALNEMFTELYQSTPAIDFKFGYSADIEATYTPPTPFIDGTPLASDWYLDDPNDQPTPQTPRGNFAWTDTGVPSFRFDIATDVGFTSIVYTNTIQAAAKAYADATFTMDTDYYVRIIGGVSTTIRSFRFPLTTRTSGVDAVITAGNAPEDMIWCPSNDRIYMCNVTGNNVTVINPTNNTVVTNIATSLNPRSLAYCPTNNRIYHTCSGGSNVRVIDPTNNTLVGNIAVGTTPQGIIYCPTVDRIYCRNSGNISVINPHTNLVVTTITASSAGYGCYVPLTDQLVFAAGTALHRVDPHTNTVVGSYTGFTDSSSKMVFCPLNRFLYVGSSNTNNTIFRVNVVTGGSVGSTSLASQAPGQLTYQPRTNRIYIPMTAGSTWQLLNPSTNTVASSISLGSTGPVSSCYHPPTDRVYSGTDVGGTDTVQVLS